MTHAQHLHHRLGLAAGGGVQAQLGHAQQAVKGVAAQVDVVDASKRHVALGLVQHAITDQQLARMQLIAKDPDTQRRPQDQGDQGDKRPHHPGLFAPTQEEEGDQGQGQLLEHAAHAEQPRQRMEPA